MSDHDHAALTERNRKLVEDFYSGVITGSPANPARLFAPDILVNESPLLPWGGTYIGDEGQKELGALQAEHVDSSSVEVLTLHADGDVVISEMRLKVDGIDTLISEHMTIRNGLIVQQRIFAFGPMDAVRNIAAS